VTALALEQSEEWIRAEALLDTRELAEHRQEERESEEVMLMER
jgi:hypothetical protein